MALPRFAWGIDIGNRALKAVKLVPSAEGFKIDDFEVIEHETVLSAAGDNRDSLVQTALANFIQRHPGIEKGQVGVGVSGQTSFARFIKLPPVEPKKIPEIVRFEAIQQIPFPLDDVEWSYQLFQDPESPEVEVGIFAMRKDLVNQHIKFFTDVDLNVQVVQMNPLAVYNAVYYDSKIKGTTMIIDLGAENTDLIIADGETIWLRSIPIGGNSFTEALSKAFKVNFAKGEDLKRNASTSKYGRQIMQAMRPIFADLVSEIQRSIGFYASVHRDSRISKVIALGGTFRLPGLQKYLQQNLQLDVEKIDSLSGGVPEDAKLAASFSENILSTVGAYGLALQVMGQGKVTSSLLPEQIRREKMWKEKTKWFAATAALFLLGAAVPYGKYYFDRWQFDQNAPIHQTVQNTISQATALDNDWSSNVENAGGPDRTRITNVRTITSGRDTWSKLYTAIMGCLPQSAADAPAEVKSIDPVELKKVPRGDRKMIIVDKMTCQYSADLTAALADPSFARFANENVPVVTDSSGSTGMDMSMMNPDNPGMGGPGMFGQGGGDNTGMGGGPVGPTVPIAPANPNGQRGFLITIRCTTPNKDGYLLVDQTLVKNLLALKPDAAMPDRPFEVKKAVIANKIKVRDDTTRMSKMLSDYQTKLARDQAAAAAAATAAAAANPNAANAGGMNPNFSPSPVSINPNQPPEQAYHDPVLDEDVRDDTECTVVFAIVLDPPALVTTPAAPKPVALAK